MANIYFSFFAREVRRKQSPAARIKIKSLAKSWCFLGLCDDIYMHCVIYFDFIFCLIGFDCLSGVVLLACL